MITRLTSFLGVTVLRRDGATTAPTAAPTAAAGAAPEAPDFAQAVRDADKPRPVTPKAVDRTKAPAAPSMIDYIKGGK